MNVGLKQAKLQLISKGSLGDKRTLCTVDRNVNWCNHYGKQYGGSSKN